jgi:hypothetical protein
VQPAAVSRRAPTNGVGPRQFLLLPSGLSILITEQLGFLLKK